MWCTIIAPVKIEDDGDQERASLTCDQLWCLLEGTVTAGQVDMRSASLWSLARHTTGTASSHLGVASRSRPQAEAR